MGRLFISHSSLDKPLVAAFVRLLETGMAVPGERILASSVEGRGVPPGIDYRAYLKGELAGSDAVLFLLSPAFYQSPFCMAEYGAAWALDSDIFVLVVPPISTATLSAGNIFANLQLEEASQATSLDVLFDFVHDKIKSSPKVAYWPAQRDKFLEEVGDLSHTSASINEAWHDRGLWSRSIVDGTIYIGNGYTVIDIRSRILQDIQSGNVLPTVYAYLTNNGFHNWLRLCEDPGYSYFSDALHLYESNSKTLASTIRGAVGTESLDIISLGPGNGRKDLLLLRALGDLGRMDSLYYYPFDINPSMVSSSMKLVGGDTALRQIKVKAILADFDALPQFKPIYQYRTGPNVFLLLGNTLGNMPNEQGFLERLHRRAMMPGDLLILEFRNQAGPTDLEGTVERNKKFDFGPLEYLGVDYKPELLEYDVKPKKSVVPNTQTLVATYKKCMIEGDEYDDVDLSYIHRYVPADIEEVCREAGFSILGPPVSNKSATALVLQK